MCYAIFLHITVLCDDRRAVPAVEGRDVERGVRCVPVDPDAGGARAEGVRVGRAADVLLLDVHGPRPRGHQADV